ncbi:MAG: NADH-quinone oxidoreductase subunit M [Polyangiales bacterium]|nr:NADH-quinone oxidoreductase subunit M [Myxococcales bacterium]MCB9661568.1 NADH-quinone oxidoreductase subunit M [Sandaracinaceae bacterium]
MNDHLLTLLLFLPLLGAFTVLFMPRQWVQGIRATSVAFMAVEFLLSLRLFDGDYSTAAFQFEVNRPWVEQVGINFHLGVDGISLWLVLLTTALTPVALFASWTSVATKVKEYAVAFLMLEMGMLGAFFALDVFLFYVFWELMLVPMYLIVGVWGGPNRVYAAVKFFLFTMVGSLLMLVAILYVVATYKELAGHYTFDLAELTRVALPRTEQCWLFAAFALAFAIKVPMFPFHTWLPDAHVQAPTGGSVILAAVMLKLGTYGFLRFAMPLFPLGSQYLGPTIALLGVVGIIYGAWAAWVQKDVKKLVAYSSVSHMGFIALGIFAMTRHGISGALLQMLNHGVSTGALFILVGFLYERRHTRDFEDFGGIAKVMPVYTLLFVIVTMSSVGLPGTNGFVGEFMIMSGAFFSRGEVGLGEYWFSMTLFSATGVIFAAVYMLHAVLKIFFGPITKDVNKKLVDLTRREKLTLAPLVVLIFWIGLFPSAFLSRMDPTVEAFQADFTTRYRAQMNLTEPRLMARRSPDLEPGADHPGLHAALAAAEGVER